MYQKEILQLRRNGVEIVSVKNGFEDVQIKTFRKFRNPIFDNAVK